MQASKGTELEETTQTGGAVTATLPWRRKTLQGARPTVTTAGLPWHKALHGASRAQVSNSSSHFEGPSAVLVPEGLGWLKTWGGGGGSGRG